MRTLVVLVALILVVLCVGPLGLVMGVAGMAALGLYFWPLVLGLVALLVLGSVLRSFNQNPAFRGTQPRVIEGTIIVRKEPSVLRPRTYYTLVVREGGTWYPQFGDYDPAIVHAERDDLLQRHDAPRRADTEIVRSADTQEAVDAAIAKLNGGVA